MRWLLSGAVGAALLGGCVRTYHPLSGLHDPHVVDTRLQNFPDVVVSVHCVPSQYLNRTENTKLCRRIGTLLENQGAVVQIFINPRRAKQDDDALLPPDNAGMPVEDRTRLVMELRARKVHASRHPLTWGMFWVSFGVLTGVTEETFAQDVEIRDESGFLLVRDTLEGRIVNRFGAGAWAGNKLLDWTVREPEERLTGDAINRDISADLYGQLSQMLFNAKVQQVVLEEASRGRP